jgi:hypothetical protein
VIVARVTNPSAGQRAWVLTATGRDGRTATVTHDLFRGPWISRERAEAQALRAILDDDNYGPGWVTRYRTDAVM